MKRLLSVLMVGTLLGGCGQEGDQGKEEIDRLKAEVAWLEAEKEIERLKAEIAQLEAEPEAFIYCSLNKKITGSAIENVGKSFDFNASEIEALRKHPEILEVGTFERNRFPVDLKLWPAGKLFGNSATANVFFESVPDEFIDVETDDWHWKEGDEKVPIIIPKFYLDLWNLSFAPVRGIPVLGADAALRMPIEIIITPDNQTGVILAGNITGFSQRINTILVPENFLQWANAKYAPIEDENMTSSSRVIIRTKAVPAKSLFDFLESNDYETDGELPRLVD